MKRTHLLALGGFVCAWLTLSVPAEASDASAWAPSTEAIRFNLELMRSDDLLVAGERLRALPAVHRFYEQRNFNAAWISAGRAKPQAAELVAAIQDAAADGLQPADYHVAPLQRLLARESLDTPEQEAELDLLLTDGFLTLASHLQRGRLDPTALDQDWTLPRRSGDPLTELTAALRDGDVAAHLRSLAPRHPGYERLKAALATYRELARGEPWPRVPDGPILRLDDLDPRVPVLRARLAAEFGATPEPLLAEHYDWPLVEQVRTFQRRHGLADDGAVGPDTLAALNVTAAERVRQILVNLERWRWLPDSLGERHIRVNVADFSMELVDGGELVMRKRVIVGKSMQRTPVFSGRLSYLVLNPSWEVPAEIAGKEILPLIQKDPKYLEKHDMQVLQGWGATERLIDPASVNWSQVSATNFPYRLRQRPGALNPLGRVKFMFPNQYAVYMHDTSARGLFARSKRAFSHGCIRVEDPLELAEWLLRNGGYKSGDRLIKTVLASGDEQVVTLSRAVPVHLLYWTAWVDDDGVIQFRHDLYGRDQRAELALLEQSAPGSEDS